MAGKSLFRAHPIKFILSFGVSAFLVWFVFRDLDIEGFWVALEGVSISYILIGAALLIYSVYVRAQRWRILISPQGESLTKDLFDSLLIGYLGNDVLPFRLGEVLRAALAARKTKLRISGIGASILVDRLLDMLSFLIITVCLFMLYPIADWAQTVAVLGFVVLVVFFLAAFLLREKRERLFQWIQGWAEKKAAAGKMKLAGHIMSLFKGVETIWQMPQPLKVTLLTIYLWVLYIIVTALGLAAFHFDFTPVEFFIASMVLLTFTTLSLSIPSAPGFVGTYHGAVVAALALVDIPSTPAKAFAIVFHLLNYLAMALPGAIIFFKTGLKFQFATDVSELTGSPVEPESASSENSHQPPI
ncbi:MAG: flippase-like domain-containing protein [Candidatus Marinimicrobia bacterium]|nr:flippase-like domain-containing protein [Candidatus Neomarinimicrobiota bacterium]MCF7840533.1 flippase-like domain-containing protein [Candidatus Neomarinimicrobiota bacterium]